jgi:hypothetical protein
MVGGERENAIFLLKDGAPNGSRHFETKLLSLDEEEISGRSLDSDQGVTAASL